MNHHSTAPVSVRLLQADPAWRLIMQSGVGMACTVGISLRSLLRDELGLDRRQVAAARTILLNGMPVDDLDNAIVPDQARLALAAGLPGIVGLALSRDSAVRGLRSAITHRQTQTSSPRAGGITLALYSLLLPCLAGHFLSRGVLVSPAQLKRYQRFAPAAFFQTAEATFTLEELLQKFPLPEERPGFLLAAHFGDALCHK